MLQTTDRQTMTYSEREHEFTFAKNDRKLMENISTLRIIDLVVHLGCSLSY